MFYCNGLFKVDIGENVVEDEVWFVFFYEFKGSLFGFVFCSFVDYYVMMLRVLCFGW